MFFPPNGGLKREANVLKISHHNLFCLETSYTWFSPLCPPFWLPESRHFLITGFCLRVFVVFWSLWEQVQGLCFSRDNETCRRTQRQRVANSSGCWCTTWSLVKQSRSSYSSQEGLSGSKDVRQERGKSSGLYGKVWDRWAPLQAEKIGWEEMLWMTQRGFGDAWSDGFFVESNLRCWDMLGTRSKECWSGEKLGCLQQSKNVVISAEVDRPKFSRLNLFLRVALNSCLSKQQSRTSSGWSFSFGFKEFLR